MFTMLFNIKQGILAEETLANLWLFAKSAIVYTLQSFPLYMVNVSPLILCLSGSSLRMGVECLIPPISFLSWKVWHS